VGSARVTGTFGCWRRAVERLLPDGIAPENALSGVERIAAWPHHPQRRGHQIEGLGSFFRPSMGTVAFAGGVAGKLE
jgi:hypothetical protein